MVLISFVCHEFEVNGGIMVLINFALNVLEPLQNLSVTIKGIFVPPKFAPFVIATELIDCLCSVFICKMLLHDI